MGTKLEDRDELVYRSTSNAVPHCDMKKGSITQNRKAEAISLAK